MTEQILGEYADNIASLNLTPTDGGRFEISIDGELVFSKLQMRRFPDMKDIRESLKAKVAS